ncbi:MAG: hypothetical protein HGA94_05355, partial [Candidatus Aminicenantes bacterium]|nr:hypothetical protein [Candidatus Aminicenantes bacterium]
CRKDADCPRDRSCNLVTHACAVAPTGGGRGCSAPPDGPGPFAVGVRTVVGEVRLVDAAGAGDAQAVSGGVTVAFKRPPDGPCVFKTVSGDVEVNFPGEPSADFRIKTMHGEVYSDFEVTYLPQAPPVRQERREAGGRYVYRSDSGYGVRTGRGGPEIKLETLTGDILIAKRSKSTS